MNIRTAGWEPLLEITFPTEDEPGWAVSIRAMPGHVGCGDTLEEAIREAADAAEAWVSTLRGDYEYS